VQEQMAGTGLETVAAGAWAANPNRARNPVRCLTPALGDCDRRHRTRFGRKRSTGARRPGDRGHLHGYLYRPRQLLACGHSILQRASFTAHDRDRGVATLASPLNAFKIVNTGEEIGAFTEDRDAAIRGVLGARRA